MRSQHDTELYMEAYSRKDTDNSTPNIFSIALDNSEDSFLNGRTVPDVI